MAAAAPARAAPLPLPSIPDADLEPVKVLAAGGQKKVTLCRYVALDCCLASSCFITP
jgi:hypothetical protein